MRIRITSLLIIMMMLFFAPYLNGCASTKVYVLGIDVNEAIKEKDVGMVVLGALASVATHVAGHYVVAELVGADIDQQGTREVITNFSELNNSDKRWFARGGFIAQTLVNTVLTSFEGTKRTKFTRGYAMGTMLEIGTYPLRRRGGGDLEYLENNEGDSSSEWVIYMGLSMYGLYRITDSN